MAKGSLFWAKARGKLGEVVLSQIKGQQISRAYQPIVANPRTTAQTDQRILFSNAVKFYKHASQALFKFAYEDKRSNESYYNVFMRKNSRVSMLPMRSQYLNQYYPAIGNQYLLTEGSLTSLPFDYYSNLENYTLTIASANASGSKLTVGELSKGLIADYHLLPGDIITFVHVSSQIQTIDDEPNNPTKWFIGQIIIDEKDNSDFNDYLVSQSVTKDDSPFTAEKNSSSQQWEIIGYSDASEVDGACIIVSRKISNQKLLVSTNYLLNNKTANSIYQSSMQAEYRNAALNSWGRKATAILQGGIVEK